MLECGMRKESSPVDFKDPANKYLMQRLVWSFGDNKWEYGQYYVNDKDHFVMELKSPKGRKRIGYECFDKKRVEVRFWDGDRLGFHFEQQIVRNPTDVKNLISVPVFPTRNENDSFTVNYDSDGKMEPNLNIKGFPKKIDVNATVKAFIEQVIAGKFSRPLLILPKK
jgi:hypothetical protein